MKQEWNSDAEPHYPIWGMLVIISVLAVAMFTTPYLTYFALLLFVFRVLRNDAFVFVTDFCVMIPIHMLFRDPGGMSLMVYLALFACVWHALRGGIYGNYPLVFFLLVLNYMILRMQTEVTKYALIISNILFLYIFIPYMDEKKSVLQAKAFCASLMLSSFVALLLRSTPQMIAIRGAESAAIWGTSWMRFQGFLKDPNYYMIQPLIGLALLMKLRDCRKISRGVFLFGGAALSLFGVLSYSKTFLLVYVVLLGVYILKQYHSGKAMYGGALIVFLVVLAFSLLLIDFSPLQVILDRIFGSKNLSDLTTGRTKYYAMYWKNITRDAKTFFFGNGYGAKTFRYVPHNLLLEIAFYSGMVGMVLMVLYVVSLLRLVERNACVAAKTPIWDKYIALIVFVCTYSTVAGMFEQTTYGELYLACLPIMITSGKPSAAGRRLHR